MKFSTNNTSDNTPDSNVFVIPQDTGNCEQSVNNYASQSAQKDDERDLMELMIASSTIPPTNSCNTSKAKSDKSSSNTGGLTKGDAKKRTRHQRDSARDLALLLPGSDVAQEEAAFGFAQAYYLKVRDRLDEQSFLQFINTLNNYESRTLTVSELYSSVMSIIKPHLDLSEEFLLFLSPEQAMELGVYMEYLCIKKMKHFLQKLEIYFCKQPQQVRKIYESLSRLLEQSASQNIDHASMRTTILPLLKGSSLLTEYFLQLFPCEKPPAIDCSDSKDFEKVDCGEFDECSIGDQHVDSDSWDWETVEIPDLEDPFGGDNCPCTCHSNVSLSVSVHCFSCGIKFINGRVFIQSGKVLRPAKLIIEGDNKKDVIERISKKPVVKDYDDKGGGPVRPKKRPAPDKSNCNTNIANGPGCGLLSPTESEDDVTDPKPLLMKIKSPKTIKSIKIMKNGNKFDINSNGKRLTEKDKDSSLPQDDNLIFDSFVLLDNLKNTKNLDSPVKNGDNEEADSASKCDDDYDDEEEDDDDLKLKDDGKKFSVPALSSKSAPPDCHDVNLIRDEDDDDVEYIDIDDIDDDDDEVDDVCDDMEEDDAHNDDDGEDEEEEYGDDDDDDDIEEVDIDEEFKREMDIEYTSDSNDVNKLNPKSTCNVNKVSSKEGNNSEQTCFIIKEEIANCEGEHNDNLKELLTVKDGINSTEENRIVIKQEFNNTIESNIPQVLSTDNVKMEIVEESAIQDSNSAPENDLLLSSVNQEKDSTPNCTSNFSENVVSSFVEMNFTIAVAATPVSTNPLPSAEEMSENSASQPCSTSLSWTKEEDKVILQTFQQESDSDKTFMTIRERLPQRSVEEIRSRFHILMLLLKRMTTNKNNME